MFSKNKFDNNYLSGTSYYYVRNILISFCVITVSLLIKLHSINNIILRLKEIILLVQLHKKNKLITWYSYKLE